MTTRTILLAERMHELLMHALDCAGSYSDETWEHDSHGIDLCSPIDDLDELRELVSICKAAKSSKSASGEQCGGRPAVDSPMNAGATPAAAPAAGEEADFDERLLDEDERSMWHACVRGNLALLNGPDLSATGHKLLARGIVELVQLPEDSILAGMYAVRKKRRGVMPGGVASR